MPRPLEKERKQLLFHLNSRRRIGKWDANDFIQKVVATQKVVDTTVCKYE
jgi:hypothetical protein